MSSRRSSFPVLEEDETLSRWQTLNHFCVNQIFQRLTPKDWIPFSKVCQSWNLVCSSRDTREFTYIGLFCQRFPHHKLDSERLQLAEFVQILEFVAPKLRYAKIVRNLVKVPISDAYISFGRFEYLVRINGDEEEEVLKNIFMKKTQSISKLKINTLRGTTSLQWKQFFRKNPVQYFKLIYEGFNDNEIFLHNFFCMLPKKLDQIGLVFKENWFEQKKILQFLGTMPRLSKLCLSLPNVLSPMIATEITKHVNAMRELCLKHRQMSKVKTDTDSVILSVIPKFIYLTKLNLSGFTLDEDLCRDIAENCQFIHCLNLKDSFLSEKSLQMLLSLPNLRELIINPIKFNLVKEVDNLQKLVINNFYTPFNSENFATALALMPNLSSLSLHGEHSLTETAVVIMKQIIKSRGKNIVLYGMRYGLSMKVYNCEKICEIVCHTPNKNKNFVIRIFTHTFQFETLLNVLTNA